MAKTAKKKAATSRKSATPSKSKKTAAPKKDVDLFASVEEIERLSSEVKKELEAFDQKGIKSAARRARKTLQELRKLCGVTRKDIIEVVKASKD
jgi:transcriptional regulator with AAA-type ATPase domain